MTAINFPDNPSVNQTFTVGDRTWKWTGSTWDAQVTKEIVGPTGPAGQQGPQGPQGIPGPTPVIAYTHTQNAVSYIWNISHNLGFRPNVTVVSSAGTVVEGDLSYIDNDNLSITFTVPFTGTAYLS
jgi:hypothetical protein